jgi:LysR family glycine cleavage system transcriptional activator
MLSASIGMTGLWLLPRLSRLQATHPGIDLRLWANDHIADLRNNGIDLAIRYAAAANVPDGAVRLFGETVVPVAHPSFGSEPLRSARALAKLTLLDFDSPTHGPRHTWLQWRGWLAHAGWGDAKPRGVLRFNQYDQVIHAALAGQGVALGRLPLVQPLLDEGRLVFAAPQSRRIETAHAYWLIQAEKAPRAAVRHVAAWIAEQAHVA